MAYDLEEQEQLDEFKAWWNKNGKMTINLVIAGLLAYAAWQGYQIWQNNQATEASTTFENVMLLQGTQPADAKAQVEKLIKNYSGTPYAGRAAVIQAKTDYAAKDNKSAKANLQWAVDHAQESQVRAIASLQLAAILLEEKDYAAAHKALDAKLDAGYQGLRDEMSGNIYLAEGKTTEAKKSFENALINLDADGRLYQYTKQKLESLG